MDFPLVPGTKLCPVLSAPTCLHFPPSVSIISSAHFHSFPCAAFLNNQYDTHKDRVQEIQIVRTFLF